MQEYMQLAAYNNESFNKINAGYNYIIEKGMEESLTIN